MPSENRAHVSRDLRFYALFTAVLAFFFVSGACGLLYQVVWTRKLVLLFGTTSYAVSTVLSVFFLGLGLGSLWGGRLADRQARPLLLYGSFEILIGLWALFFILSIAYGEGVVVAILKVFHFSRGTGLLLRAVLALALLFVPVLLMGATLPLLAKFVNREAQVRGLRIGALYTLNTFGAVAGCFLTGFVLLAQFGYMCTTLLGAAANLAIGALAVLLSLRGKTTSSDRSGPEISAAADRMPDIGVVRFLVLAAFSLQGFCALALEVLWTRLLIIVFLGTTYAYTTMLTTVLCGIALGSALSSLIVDRIRGRVAVLGGIMILTGVSCMLMLGWIGGLPQQIAELLRQSANNWRALTAGTFALSFSALFVPTFCFGMTFPLAVKAVSASRVHLGRDVGRLYSANTIGGVFGALAGGYVLIPWLGTHRGIVFSAILFGIAGVILVMACPATLRRGKAVILVVALAMAVWAWTKAPADVSQALNAGYVPKDHRVIHYREGVEGTVAVTEPIGDSSGSNRILWINRVQATASIEKGVKMNRLQGVLPLLFDRDPRRVLFMCFGSGITCGALALSDFDRIDAVEISKDVIEAAPFFDADNLGVLKRPNLEIHIDDGRNFLLTTDNRYDVITFEPMPLALAGVSTFYTQEYYRLCLARLTPGGLVSQWVPLHSLNPGVVRSLVYTFTTVFPDYCAWFVNADIFLIGSNAPLRLDYTRCEQRLNRPDLKAALDEVGLRDIPEVLACFLMNKHTLDAYAAGGEVMTDDCPWAEFIAPKLVEQRTVPESIAAIQPFLATPLGLLDALSLEPAVRDTIYRRHQAHVNDFDGLRAYYGGMSIDSTAPDRFKESLRIDPNDYNAQYYLKQIVQIQAQTFLRWQEYHKAQSVVQDALRYLPEDLELHDLLNQVLAALSNTGSDASEQHP